MSDQMKNLLIGLFIVAAMLATAWSILFFKPSIGDGKKTLHVRFSNIAGISVGTRVTLAGKPIGEVEAIKEVKTAREDQMDPLGRIYFYELTLRVDSSVEIYNSDELAIRTTGLLGEKSIAIIPKAPRKGQESKNVTDQVLYADSTEPLEQAFHQVSEVAEKLQSAVGNFEEWFVENEDELSNAIKSFADAMGEAHVTLKSFNEKDMVTSIKDAVDVFTDNMKLIRDALQEMHQNEMVAKFDEILTNFVDASQSIKTDGSQMLANINKFTKQIADGKGTLGRLISDDDFYLRLTNLMGKVDTLMNDINHYGLLFQYDKHWQRLRTKRANLMSALQSPKEFRQYYETEIDSINTSIERLAMLLEKAEKRKKKDELVNSPSFKKDFADLLRKVDGFMDSLKLYNEDLIEHQDQETPKCDP
jgi:phospholipid/cholesterol/gamma-HCH transport system substrate-binding protein